MIKYNKKQIEAFEQACNDFDLRFHDDYSGRFMFGEECIAVSGDLDTIADMCDSLADDYHQPKMAREILGKWKRDNLGMGIIIYNG